MSTPLPKGVHWLMPVVLGNQKEERWWCPCGVVNQQERTECFYFVREAWADDE